ncbi:MAG: FGGY family carbohydrate kinase [Collinsella sp.]
MVWQCARARELCDELAAREGVAELVRDTTGLVLSPYYPAGKMAWILANVPAAAEAAASGELYRAPSTWAVWTLTGGGVSL